MIVVILQHVFNCDECTKSETQNFDARGWGLLPPPEIPSGWTRVNERIYCPRHEIALQITPARLVPIR